MFLCANCLSRQLIRLLINNSHCIVRGREYVNVTNPKARYNNMIRNYNHSNKKAFVRHLDQGPDLESNTP